MNSGARLPQRHMFGNDLWGDKGRDASDSGSRERLPLLRALPECGREVIAAATECEGTEAVCEAVRTHSIRLQRVPLARSGLHAVHDYDWPRALLRGHRQDIPFAYKAPNNRAEPFHWFILFL